MTHPNINFASYKQSVEESLFIGLVRDRAMFPYIGHAVGLDDEQLRFLYSLAEGARRLAQTTYPPVDVENAHGEDCEAPLCASKSKGRRGSRAAKELDVCDSRTPR